MFRIVSTVIKSTICSKICSFSEANNDIFWPIFNNLVFIPSVRERSQILHLLKFKCWGRKNSGAKKCTCSTSSRLKRKRKVSLSENKPVEKNRKKGTRHDHRNALHEMRHANDDDRHPRKRSKMAAASKIGQVVFSYKNRRFRPTWF